MKIHFQLTAQILALLVIPTVAFGAEAGFEPLMTSLERFHGDKGTWALGQDVLSGRLGAQDSGAGRILTVERFGNFVLRFQARADSHGATVLVRAAVHPIEVLAGYEFRLGPSRGSLSFLDLPDFRKLAEARAKGVPYDNAMALHAWDPPSEREADWTDFELACLGDRLTLTRNGETVVHYRHAGGPLEGSIGFGLDPAGHGEFRNLQIRLLGRVQWPTQPPEGVLDDLSASGWTAEDSPFERMREQEWANETRQLLQRARATRGFRPLVTEGASSEWKESRGFWTLEDGVIRGESRNHFLVSAREYADFILKAQVRLSPKTGNSGIQVRSRLSETGMEGYQIDMAVFDTGKGMLPWWGQIYGEEVNRGFLFGIDDPARRLALVRHGDWNDVVIVCKGNHLIVELNGEVTADLVDYFGDRSGKIGLQVHVGPPMKVEFRDVLILEF